MMVPSLRAAVLAVAATSVLAACEEQARTTATPSTAYAKTSTATAAPRGACLAPEELQAVRNEITWQQFYNAAIQCEKGTPAFRSEYGAFRNKYRGDIEANNAQFQRAAGKVRVSRDGLKLEIANRDGPSAGGNPRYCAEAQQAFRWALSTQPVQLAQVPPMLDFTPDMGLRSCAATPAATPARK
ncbi:MAG TPA: hypothetical protein VJ890_10930 [Vineibacter sp.]|nr:hypothetical protein [Vineibacter sp.]